MLYKRIVATIRVKIQTFRLLLNFSMIAQNVFAFKKIKHNFFIENTILNHSLVIPTKEESPKPEQNTKIPCPSE